MHCQHTCRAKQGHQQRREDRPFSQRLEGFKGGVRESRQRIFVPVEAGSVMNGGKDSENSFFAKTEEGFLPVGTERAE